MPKITQFQPPGQLVTLRVINTADGRDYLRAVGELCIYAADRTDDGREALAMLRTLADMPVLLRRQRLQ